MPIAPLEHSERILAAIRLGESHFREFKSALEGPEGAKKPRSSKSIRRDIAEALVAFANADGGELLIGVEDDGQITGVPHTNEDTESFLESVTTGAHSETPLPAPLKARVEIDAKLVIYFSVQKSTRLVHLTSDGRCLQRRDRETVPVSSERIRFERQEQLSREYDRQFVDGADVSALDPDILARVGSKLGPGLSPEKLLQQLDLADYDRGVVRLRRAALLLFAREPRRWHPRSEIRILRVTGTEMKAGPDYNVVKDQVVTGPILALMSTAWDALRYYLVQTKFGPGGVFEERILYPEDACLEALTNGIAHRDYAIEGRGIEILVFDDRMEVRSPGSLLSNVTLDDLMKARGVHQSRNSFIARVLRELGYMREMGEGFRRIYQLMKSHDLVEPELMADTESFSITLHHRSVFTEDAQRWLTAFEKFNLTKREKKVVLLGRERTPFSPQQVWDALDLVDTEDYRSILEGLQLKGLLISTRTKQAAASAARSRHTSVRRVARFAILDPADAEIQFAELMRALQSVAPRSSAVLSQRVLADVCTHLSAENPFRTNGPTLGKVLERLGLVDPERRPLAVLRALLDTQMQGEASPKRRVTREPAAPVLTNEESQEFVAGGDRTLFVGNLDFDTTEADLLGLFQAFGPVEYVRIPADFFTGRGRGYGFAKMTDTGAANVAKDTLTGRSFRGRPLHLDWARR